MARRFFYLAALSLFTLLFTLTSFSHAQLVPPDILALHLFAPSWLYGIFLETPNFPSHSSVAGTSSVPTATQSPGSTSLRYSVTTLTDVAPSEESAPASRTTAFNPFPSLLRSATVSPSSSSSVAANPFSNLLYSPKRKDVKSVSSINHDISYSSTVHSNTIEKSKTATDSKSSRPASSHRRVRTFTIVKTKTRGTTIRVTKTITREIRPMITKTVYKTGFPTALPNTLHEESSHSSKSTSKSTSITSFPHSIHRPVPLGRPPSAIPPFPSHLKSNNTKVESYLPALAQLMRYYSPATGLFNSTGWWNSASALTTLVDYVTLQPGLLPYAKTILNNTFHHASGRGAVILKTNTPGSEGNDLTKIFWEAGDGINTTSADFLNPFYDDEGWWALMWLRAYDVTGEKIYLNTSRTIFADMAKGWNTPKSCGGLWWSKRQNYVSAISNELFFALAAGLSNRVHSPPQDVAFYRDWAQTIWTWFEHSGLINAAKNINDGLDDKCKNNGKEVWSYNQGVILTALVEFFAATNGTNSTLLDTATAIAKAAIGKLGQNAKNSKNVGNAILREPCEPNLCGEDGKQFKGVFLRGLRVLHRVVLDDLLIARFVQANAKSIWDKDREAKSCQLGLRWTGPYVAEGAGAATQSSSLDALVADMVGG